MPKKKPEQPVEEIIPDAPIPQTPDASVPSLTDAPELSTSNPVVISKESSTEKSHISAQTSNSPVISTTEGRRNPMFSAATPESPSNPVVISNPALPAGRQGSAGEKSPNKPKHFRVTSSDVFYKGKSYPEGSIVDFQDDHLNKYLVPIIDDDITKDDTVYDTSTIAPVSMDTSLDPKYVASRRRGRPRQL